MALGSVYLSESTLKGAEIPCFANFFTIGAKIIDKSFAQ
jgi:hypothetical protein